MAKTETLDELRSRIEAGYPLLLLTTHEEQRWEEELAMLCEELDRGLVTWSLTSGLQPALTGEHEGITDPHAMLSALREYPSDHLFLVRDLQHILAEPGVVRSLKDLAEHFPSRRNALLILSTVSRVPPDLSKHVVQLTLPFPALEELRTEFALARRSAASDFSVDPTDEERLLQAALGLTAREARHAFGRSLLGKNSIDDEVYNTLIAEKRHLVAGSDFLEFYDLDDGIDNVGGLDNLKMWLSQRSQAFSMEARDQGIPLPKGVLLLGVQGCGKSLTARASAKLLHFPLVRLDASHLLSADQGESEQNMRRVLRVLEAISPTVLWIDEMEKGFAGVGGSSTDGTGNATMARLFGQFLTWMEQRDSPIFVVATANSVDQLPPELLRKGRFDELFFIDLPNYHERQNIFGIHIQKRGWNPEKYDLVALSEQSEGYSGAEIEQVVSAAMLDAYTRGDILTQDDLKNTIDDTVPLSITMEDQIYRLREWARTRCRPATADSRVVEMLEEEERLKVPEDDFEDDTDETPEWVRLAEYGQVKAALVSFVSNRDRATFNKLVQAFGDYMPTVGEQGIALKGDPNLVLWLGLSAELATLLVKLISSRRLYLHPCRAEIYEGDTGHPELPTRTSLPDERVEAPEWFPAYITHFPSEHNDPRLTRLTRMMLKT